MHSLLEQSAEKNNILFLLISGKMLGKLKGTKIIQILYERKIIKARFSVHCFVLG